MGKIEENQSRNQSANKDEGTVSLVHNKAFMLSGAVSDLKLEKNQSKRNKLHKKKLTIEDFFICLFKKANVNNRKVRLVPPTNKKI